MKYQDDFMEKEDIKENLLKLDREIYLFTQSSRSIDVVIVGSTCLAFLANISRRTQDIDILKMTHNIPNDILHKYKMNTAVQAFGESNLPYNYEDRLVYLNINTKIINYYLLSLEDIIISKIYAGREKDKFDINLESVIKKIDWIKLEKCAKEMEMSAMNLRVYKEFKDSYNDFLRRYRGV